jgi:hypothetical protein
MSFDIVFVGISLAENMLLIDIYFKTAFYVLDYECQLKSTFFV